MECTYLRIQMNSIKRQKKKKKMVSQLAVNCVRSSVRTDMGQKGGRDFTGMRQQGMGRKPPPITWLQSWGKATITKTTGRSQPKPHL